MIARRGQNSKLDFEYVQLSMEIQSILGVNYTTEYGGG